jgi:hypothetical protein
VEPGESAVLPLTVTVGADETIATAVAIAGAVTFHRAQATITVPVSAIVDVVSPVEIVSTVADPEVLEQPGDSAAVTVTIRNRRVDAPLTGAVEFTAPDDWGLDPGAVAFNLAAGAEASVKTSVTPPSDANLPVGSVKVAAVYGDTKTVGDRSEVRITSLMKAWNFDTAADTEGWKATNQLSGFTVADGALKATSTGGDPNMGFTGPMSLDASSGAVVEITMTTSTTSEAKLFWGTVDEPGPAEARSGAFTVDAGGSKTYRVTIPPQSSPLATLRFDPLNSVGDVQIDSIRVLR